MDLIKWLLEGDVSIQYQTHRDLLGKDIPSLRKRISSEGFGKMLLDLQQEDGHWGGGYYRKKWISTHYTLLELIRLNINSTERIKNSIEKVLTIFTKDSKANIVDICMNGMALNFFCYFHADEDRLKVIVDYIISQQMPDGGFNCNYNKHSGAVHSSLHSTVSLIEGFNSYEKNGYRYRLNELIKIRENCIEFILIHKLFISDRTNKVIKKSFTMLSYPPRWKYDILRALEAFRDANISYDERMYEAFELLKKKRRKDGTWPLQAKHHGVVHFDMEKPGLSSRWNTLRALRVLSHFQIK